MWKADGDFAIIIVVVSSMESLTSSNTHTNNTLSSRYLITRQMAYVQVEADDVRTCAIFLLALLQRLIFVHSNGLKRGQKLSSSNVLHALSRAL